jgi:hypothetical protein
MSPRVVHFYFPIFGTLFIPIDTKSIRNRNAEFQPRPLFPRLARPAVSHESMRAFKPSPSTRKR